MSRDIVAVPETPVRLRVNGLDAARWTCTPEALEALGAGRLRSLGFVARRADLVALEAGPDGDDALVIRAEVEPARAAMAIEERDHRAEHGCGPRFFLDCRPRLIHRDDDAPAPAALPPLDAFADLFRQLYEGSETYRSTGGLHTACLSDGESVSRLHEEVARHNAVDKAIGQAFLDDVDPARFGLLTTARISGEIAIKAARAGLAWIASRSVPTTLAVEVAAAAGIPIVARAAKPESRVFGGEAS